MNRIFLLLAIPTAHGQPQTNSPTPGFVRKTQAPTIQVTRLTPLPSFVDTPFPFSTPSPSDPTSSNRPTRFSTPFPTGADDEVSGVPFSFSPDNGTPLPSSVDTPFPLSTPSPSNPTSSNRPSGGTPTSNMPTAKPSAKLTDEPTGELTDEPTIRSTRKPVYVPYDDYTDADDNYYSKPKNEYHEISSDEDGSDDGSDDGLDDGSDDESDGSRSGKGPSTSAKTTWGSGDTWASSAKSGKVKSGKKGSAKSGKGGHKSGKNSDKSGKGSSWWASDKSGKSVGSKSGKGSSWWASEKAGKGGSKAEFGGKSGKTWQGEDVGGWHRRSLRSVEQLNE